MGQLLKTNKQRGCKKEKDSFFMYLPRGKLDYGNSLSLEINMLKQAWLPIFAVDVENYKSYYITGYVYNTKSNCPLYRATRKSHGSLYYQPCTFSQTFVQLT